MSTLVDLEAAMEELPTIGDVVITTSGSDILSHGNILDVLFKSEFGNLPIVSMSNGNKVTKKIAGQTPYRKEIQTFFCDGIDGSARLSFGDKETVINYDTNMHEVSDLLTALSGTSVRVIDDDFIFHSICNPSGQVTHVIFDDIVNDIPPFQVVSFSGSSGSFEIFGDGEDEYGAVNGLNPLMGHFSISFGGESTTSIPVYASANEVESKLKTLSKIGSVAVSKNTVELAHINEHDDFAKNGIGLYSIWSITFADVNTINCRPNYWENCPSNIGDVDILKVDTSSTYTVLGNQDPSKRGIYVVEAVKGMLGNNRTDESTDLSVEFEMRHSANLDTGISSHEYQTLTCSYDPTALILGHRNGTFTLNYLSERVMVDATSNIESLKELISVSFPGLSVDVMGSHSTICHFDDLIPTKTLIRIRFLHEGPSPNFEVSNTSGVFIKTVGTIEGHKPIQYIGKGSYEIRFTPKISGHYSLSLLVNGAHVPVDFSIGLFVTPSTANAISSSFVTPSVSFEGANETILIQSMDKFGNLLDTPLPQNEAFLVDMIGYPDDCSGISASQVVPISLFDKGQGSYEAFYQPGLAGKYLLSVRMRKSGGLLGTYYRDSRFRIPVHGNTEHLHPPFYEVPWCPDIDTCDSTRMDEKIVFDWGYRSPDVDGNEFPIDYFSIIWEGEINVPQHGEYKFIIYLNGGTKLSIGSSVIIDQLDSVTTVVKGSVKLDANLFYSIKLWYRHITDEAYIKLFWVKDDLPAVPVPSSYLFYSRYVGRSQTMVTNPYEISSHPGDVDVLSWGFGDGLSFCVANDTCSFYIQTRDAFGNNRFNNGTTPEFDITITGKFNSHLNRSMT